MAKISYGALQESVKAVNQFGLLKGLSLFFAIKLGIGNSFKIPGFKKKMLLRPNTSDASVFFQIFVGKEYEFDILKEGSDKALVIIDAGANIGLSALYFKNKFPSSKIICVEPDTENFAVLKQNLNHLDNITLINAAIWHKKTKLQISDKFNSGKWGIVTEEIEKIENEGNMIDAISIDEILKENQIQDIDILKIDIECAEKYLFSDNYLSWLPKTKMVIIELHEHLCSGCSQPFFEAIGKSFKNYSYHIRCENTMIINKDLSS